MRRASSARLHWSVLALLLPSVVAGCFGRRLPPRELYRLEIPESLTTGAAGRDGSVIGSGLTAVLAYRTPGIYGDRAIPYRIGEREYGTYPSREWALPLGTMLGVLTQDVLRQRPITAGGALFDPPARGDAALVWRGVVREFEEVNRGREVYAAVHLEVRITRAADDSLLWSGSLRRERRVTEG